PYWETCGLQPGLLANSILHDAKHGCVRTHRCVTRRCFEAGERNLLDLEGHYVRASGKMSGGVDVVERRGETAVDHEACGTRAVRIEHLHAVAKRAGGHGGHASKLSAAENANGCAGKDGTHEGSSMPSTSCCRAARHARIRSRRAASLRAQISAASNAAFAAPGWPMAKVPTGTPLGICTMESNESTPLRMVAGIGTPKTGRIVLAATMPGR